MGNITIQGTITGNVTGGAIGGAASVTTGGVLFGTAAGVAGTSADITFDAATSVLAIRRSQVNSPVTNADLPARSAFLGRGSAGVGANPTLSLFTTATGNGIASFAEATFTAMPLALQPFGGNLLLGTTTDGNFRLDVGSSGSSGTTRIYDQTATTGTTQLVVRAGAGQSSTNLMTWQNSGGTQVAALNSSSIFLAVGFQNTSDNTYLGAGLDLGSARLISWSSTAPFSGTKDASLSRASANTIQVGDGGANANGSISAASATFSRATGAASIVTSSGSTDAYNTVQGNGAYINLYSTLAGPYAGTQINKSTNTRLWFTGLQGTDDYSWFTGVSFIRLASLATTGTFSLYNETPTTGVTSLVVRAGAGQGTTNLQTWQNAAGTGLAYIAPGGGVVAVGVTVTGAAVNAGPGIDLGLDSSAGQSVLIRPGGSERLRATSTFFRTTNAQLYQFSSDATSFGTPDSGFSRNAAGVLEINNGTAGAFRDLYLRGVRPVGVTVANLPAAASNTGMMATVTDANATTIGTTVAGGGANTVLVWSNGTNWRIYAN